MTTTPNVSTPATGGYALASLYVGDLHPDVSESMLFDKFTTIGPVLSIRVCRDAITRRSLGYAYINYQQPVDAEKALDVLNFEPMCGKPMRIMWSQRDPASRRAPNSNIFIKNLDKSVDTRSLHDTFNLFGSILSAKVAYDETGASKGYGFVHFETEEAANTAITKVDGMILAGKKVNVCKFLPRAARMREESGKKFTNVFVKNLELEVSKDKLEIMFNEFGEIISCAVMEDGNGKSKGFGFISFENSDDAEKAVEKMHDSQPEGSDKRLHVCRAQKKHERATELKRRFDSQKAEKMQRWQGVNLYVKNLDETIDDAKLKEAFDEFGTISSAKMMVDEQNRTKGFGFVCFEKPEEATKAVAEMNGKMLLGKPLFVAIAQRKEDRRAQLASLYMSRIANMRMGQAAPPTMFTPNGGYFVNSAPAQQPRSGFMPTTAAVPTRMGAVGPAAQRWQAPGGGFATATGPANSVAFTQPMYASTTQQQAPMGARPNGFAPQQHLANKPPRYPAARVVPGQQQNMMGRYAPMVTMPKVVSYPIPAGHQRPNPAAIHHSMMKQAKESAPLDPSMLARASPQEQKQLLGERIYAGIERSGFDVGGDVGKVTGMLLEMENSELLMMLNDEDMFRAKTTEACAVLRGRIGAH